MPSGSLTVVGLGIKFAAQVSVEARNAIEQAEKVLYGVADPASEEWLARLNPSAESLVAYQPDRPRRTSYSAWTEQILSELKRGLRVCTVFYGHPGVFVFAGHEAIRRARQDGYEAVMLPGVSAEDCLFADLGVDPSRRGCQSFEATDFLLRRRRFDPTSALILWQVALVGELGPPPNRDASRRVALLRDRLLKSYPPDHRAIVYEAALLALFCPRIESVALAGLDAVELTSTSTLYVPPLRDREIDRKMAGRLGIPGEYLESYLVSQETESLEGPADE